MDKITYPIILDTHKSGIQHVIQGVNAGDNMSRRLEISLRERGKAYSIPTGTNIVAIMYVKKPSVSQPDINYCEIDGDKIIYDLQPSDTATEGIVSLTLKLIEGTVALPSKILISPRMEVEVSENDADDSAAEGTNQYTALETALIQAQAVYNERITSIEVSDDGTFTVTYADDTTYTSDAIKNSLAASSTAISSANTATTAANTAADTANTAADRANNAAQFIENISEQAIPRATATILGGIKSSDEIIVGTDGTASLPEDVAFMEDYDSSETTDPVEYYATKDQLNTLNINLTEHYATKAMLGSPLVASTSSAMTDTTKVYVYTGSEEGYTNGNWYYHNGTAFVSGGVYNASAVQTDKELISDGVSADAKVTGDKISELNEDLSNKGNAIVFKSGKWINSTGVISNGGTMDYYTDYISVKKGNKIITNIGARSNANIMSLYSNADESSYVSGATGGGDNATLLPKEFVIEQDGYIRLYFLNDLTSSDQTYAYIFDANEVKILEKYIGNNNENIKHISMGLEPLLSDKYCFKNGSYQNDGTFSTWNKSVVESYNKVYTDTEIRIKINNGYKVACHYWNGSIPTFKSACANLFTIPANTTYTIQILKDNAISSDFADVDEYIDAISVMTTTTSRIRNIQAYNGSIFGYRHIAFTFAGTVTDGMIILGSNDLRQFNLISKRGFYSATKTHTISDGTSVINTIRDPAIIKIGTYYYITYTIIGFDNGSNQIGLCRTKDFIEYEELNNLTISSPLVDKNISKVWAPSWFRDGDDVYIVSSCGDDNNSFWTVLSTFDSIQNIAYGGNKLDNLIGIDYHLFHENDCYYALGGGNKIYKSATLSGTYTEISNNLPAGTSNISYEAHFIQSLDNGKKRLYRQKFVSSTDQSTSSSAQVFMVYNDADNLEGIWGDEHIVSFNADATDYLAEINQKCYYHWTLYDFFNGNDNNNYYTT